MKVTKSSFSLLFLLLLLCAARLPAQSIERYLVGVSGTIGKAPQVELNYSVGELTNSTLQGTGSTVVICTQGYQQKQIQDIINFVLSEQWYSLVRVDVYPNPFTDQITVYVYNDNFDKYRVEITDEMERVVGRYELTQNKQVISLKHLPVGMYRVKFFNTHLQDEGSLKRFKPVKIVKVNQ